MNKQLLNKILYATFIILGSSSAYMFWQNKALSGMLTQNQEKCEQQTSDLLNKLEQGWASQVKIEIEEIIKIDKKSEPVKTAVTETQSELAREKPKLQAYSETMEDIVRRKYRFLFNRLSNKENSDALLALLIQREEVYLQILDAEEFGDELGADVGEIADLRYQLEQIDEQVQALLGDEVAERFVLLKESDEEQEEFSQYTLGINGLFPLSRQQQETVLITRLREKQKFEEIIKETGFDMDFPLTREQQQKTIGLVRAAVLNYREGYLRDVRPHLDTSNFPMDQYTLLENYTKTEFDQFLEEFKNKIEARGVIETSESEAEALDQD